MNKLIKSSIDTSGRFTGRVVVFLFISFFLPFLYVSFGFKKPMYEIIAEFKSLPETEKKYIYLKGFCFFVGISSFIIISTFIFLIIKTLI